MSEEKSELPPVVWSKRGDVYSEEEAEQKHSLGNKETILVGNEVVRQMKEKERIEKAMNDFSDKMHMEICLHLILRYSIPLQIMVQN